MDERKALTPEERAVAEARVAECLAKYVGKQITPELIESIRHELAGTVPRVLLDQVLPPRRGNDA